MGLTRVKGGGIQPTILDPIQNLYTGSTVVFTVTVASKDTTHRYNGQGSSNGYKIDGKFAPFLVLTPGVTYKFDQADGSNSGHPLRFYKDANKVTAYTTNVTTNGTAGSSGAYTQIVTGDATPTILYYQCSAHGLMGNAVQTNGLASSVPDDGSITTAKLADDAVNNDKLANSVVASIAANTAKTSLEDNSVTTVKIADQAVTLAKLPHGTGSNDGKFLRANNGADPTFESLPASGVTVSNNANNRVVTGDGTNLNAEANLTFDGTTLQLGGATADSADIDSSNTKLTIKQSANNTEDGIFIERSGERRGFYIHIGGALGVSDGLSIVSNQHGNETAVLAIDRGGEVRIGAGNLVFSSAGNGIDFSATANSSGSMGSELLDDYEEGTWTPTINVGTFTTFLTNRYIKIGKLVHLHGGLIFHNNSSGSRVEISNIPFSQQSSGQYVGNVWLRRTSTGEKNWNCIIGEAGSNIIAVFRDSNGNDMGGHLTYSDFQHSSTYFNYSITYIAAS